MTETPSDVVAATTMGPLQVTAYGRRLIALAWFERGKSFLAAAVFLQQRGGSEFVVLYLMCQGIEVILKGILLLIDYNKYKPLLHLRGLHHNLVATADTVLSAIKLFPMRSGVRSELEALSNLYSQHLLRYGSQLDLLVDPHTIPSRLVIHRIAAAIRLVERQNARAVQQRPAP